VATAHRALEWLARRRDGESAALIAWRDGVSTDTVLRATKPYGPSPRATRHLGRTHLSPGILDERTARWVADRRRGLTVTKIAKAEGVRHQYVSRHTIEYGPYPDPAVAEDWVAARKSGQSVSAIADTAGVSETVVRAATKPYGPFRARFTRTPDGVLGVTAIARQVGMSEPAVLRWVRAGRLPEPNFIAGGRRLWLASTIETWLVTSGLAKCPQCGARCLSLGQHLAAAHRTSRTP
jgi:predicted DNA-binding transcriptional regulator AlpA